ncbi:helicase HerA-like domain-containing protein [Blastococcus sp. SYSU DS0973]
MGKTVSAFRRTEDHDLEMLLTGLGISEAAVTVLSDRGTPTSVAWTMIRVLESPIHRSFPRPGVGARPELTRELLGTRRRRR